MRRDGGEKSIKSIPRVYTLYRYVCGYIYTYVYMAIYFDVQIVVFKLASIDIFPVMPLPWS